VTDQTTTTVLVVDDDTSTLAGLRALLEEEGYQVEVAAGGEEALSIVTEQAPDVVLLDVCMPEMSGWELQDRLRWGGHTMPVIFMSANHDYRRPALRRADGYLPKPFDSDLLVETIERVALKSE
jgi:CheY-like chemotaxis protein